MYLILFLFPLTCRCRQVFWLVPFMWYPSTWWSFWKALSSAGSNSCNWHFSVTELHLKIVIVQVYTKHFFVSEPLVLHFEFTRYLWKYSLYQMNICIFCSIPDYNQFIWPMAGSGRLSVVGNYFVSGNIQEIHIWINGTLLS